MGKPAKLAHVILRTRDVERLAQWYESALGAWRTVDRSPMMVFMTYDEEHHRIGFMRMEEEASGETTNAPGLAHIAFTYPSASALLASYAELKARNVLPVLTVHHGPTLSAYYRDPDGNVVEMFADVFATAAEADEYMNRPEFRASPVAKSSDFDALLARANEGADEAELLAYPRETVDPWGLAKQMKATLEGRV